MTLCRVCGPEAPQWHHFCALLPSTLIRAQQQGWFAPRALQASIMHALLVCDRDVVVSAPPRSGKTLALLMACVHHCRARTRAGCAALMLAPTRELVRQHGDWLARLGVDRVLASVGGGEDAVHASDAEIVIATPGRAYDMISNGVLYPERITMVGLDEAEDMLGEGFAEQIKHLMLLLPRQARVAVAATRITRSAKRCNARMLCSPAVLDRPHAPPARACHTVKHMYALTEPAWHVRAECLDDLYGLMPVDACVVFCGTKAEVVRMCTALQQRDFPAVCIHSDQDPATREAAMTEFCSRRSRVLVTTDMLARGIELPHVSVVCNASVPTDGSHLLARAAHADRSHCGVCLTLLTEAQQTEWSRVVAEARVACEPL